VTLTGLDVVTRTGVSMRTRDGVELVADLWHPADGAGPWPGLLVRTPYGRALASSVTAPHPAVLARRGYVVASMDVRGRGDSGGQFTPFAHEAADGADAICWLAERPECDGRVGTYGFSYQGVSQLLAAAERPRPLAAIAPAMCSADPGDGFLFQDGILRQSFAVGWASQLAGADGFLGDATPAVLARRIAEGRVDDWPHWDDWAAGRCGPTADLARIQVPALVTLGWYDLFSAAGSRDLAELGDRGWLHAAPWAHMPWAPDLLDSFDTHLAFFDQHLAGRPATPVPRARVLPIGGTWQDLPAWPPPVEERRWWLSGDGLAASRWGRGRLADREAPGPPEVTVFQPDVPVPAPTIGPGAGHDDAALLDRTDVLVFTGPPLVEAVEIAGTARARLALSSDAPTADACVTLYAVSPDGASTFLAFGAARGPADVDVTLSPVHAVVAAGDRLRVAIAPSAYPYLARNLSGGGAQVTRVLGASSWIEVPLRADAGH
jgi:predicted acyl esterase